MGKTYGIKWTKDAASDFEEILSYIKYRTGKTSAKIQYDRVIINVEKLKVFPDQGKISEDLRSIGIVSIHEIVETPWRIFYKIEDDTVYILSILDGRRNIEEILYKKVIEGKLQ